MKSPAKYSPEMREPEWPLIDEALARSTARDKATVSAFDDAFLAALAHGDEGEHALGDHDLLGRPAGPRAAHPGLDVDGDRGAADALGAAMAAHAVADVDGPVGSSSPRCPPSQRARRCGPSRTIRPRGPSGRAASRRRCRRSGWCRPASRWCAARPRSAADVAGRSCRRWRQGPRDCSTGTESYVAHDTPYSARQARTRSGSASNPVRSFSPPVTPGPSIRTRHGSRSTSGAASRSRRRPPRGARASGAAKRVRFRAGDPFRGGSPPEHLGHRPPPMGSGRLDSAGKHRDEGRTRARRYYPK